MNSIDQFSRIEGYVKGEMSLEERQLFEAELRTNPILKEDYENFLIAKHAAEVLVYESVKERLQSTDVSKVKPLGRRYLLQVAATIALLVTGTLFYTNLTLSDRQISAQFLLEIDEVHTRSVEHPDSYMELLAAFSRDDFQEVTRIFQSSQFTSEYLRPAEKMYAFSQMQTGQYPQAIESFEKLASDPNNLTRSREEFNLALAYLNTGQETRAREILQNISADGQNDFREDARLVLNKLSNPLRKLVF